MFIAALKLKTGDYVSIGLFETKSSIESIYVNAISHSISSAAEEIKDKVVDFYDNAKIEIFDIDIFSLVPDDTKEIGGLKNDKNEDL